ncbi:hypothetical protein B0H14DRAFT_2644341 [Mycena olivaceomarginata]|nr:hypothetical protein B0H14DRAFT_2644341 [Mycena olivaceomarginata]
MSRVLHPDCTGRGCLLCPRPYHRTAPPTWLRFSFLRSASGDALVCLAAGTPDSAATKASQLKMSTPRPILFRSANRRFEDTLGIAQWTSTLMSLLACVMCQTQIQNQKTAFFAGEDAEHDGWESDADWDEGEEPWQQGLSQDDRLGRIFEAEATRAAG